MMSFKSSRSCIPLRNGQISFPRFRASAEPVVERGDALAIALDRKQLRLGPAALGQFGTQAGIGGNRLDRPRDLVGLVWIDIERGVAGDFGERRGARRYDRRSEQHRLEDRQAKPLVKRGEQYRARAA